MDQQQPIASFSTITDRSRRLNAELRNIKRSEQFGEHVELVEDALDVWHVELYAKHFPTDTDLHKDLLHAASIGQKDHLLMEIRFPLQYPNEPPFFRIVYPRFQYHTGHVSGGGSICLESLVNTGTAAGYNSIFTVEGLLVMVVFNLTLNNPSANVSPGRLDFKRERSPDRTGYALQDARDAFTRIIQQHSWATAPPVLPTTAKPMCKYGSKCYRKNPQHLAEFDHPPKDANDQPQSLDS